MPMSLQELKNLLAASSKKTFTLSGEKLDVGGSGALFTQHLPDATITIPSAKTDELNLTVEGSLKFKDPASVPVKVSFTADDTYVSGYKIVGTLSTWKFGTVSISADYEYLSTNFGMIKPGVILRSTSSTAGDARFSCVLGAKGFTIPLDGSTNELVADGDVDTNETLSEAAQKMGFKLLDNLKVKLSDIWGYIGVTDDKKKFSVISGTVKLSDTSKIQWGIVVLPAREKQAEPEVAIIVQSDLNVAFTNASFLQNLIPPESGIILTHAQLILLQDPVTEKDVKKYNGILKSAGQKTQKKVPKFPDGELGHGVTGVLGYEVGGNPRDIFKIRLGAASESWSDKEKGKSPDAKKEKQAEPKSIGPICLGGFSLGWSAGFVQFTCDLTAKAVATIDIPRIMAEIDFNSGEVRPIFTGAGLGYKQENFLFAIAVRNLKDKDYIFRWEGIGLIQTPPIVIGIVGSYMKKAKDDIASWFIFASLGAGKNAEGIGWPPVLFKGLYGGYGHNSEIRTGAVSEIAKFPFVAGLDDENIIGKDPDPMKVLDTLTKSGWVNYQAGEDWAALGVHLTLFEFIDVRMLVIVEFRSDLIVSLMSLTRFEFPTVRPPDVDPTVRLMVAGEGFYRHNEGVVMETGQFTDDSYILVKECKPVGGLAFCVWFSPSPHAGDFVVSIGGYHPAFLKPGWYPAVPRVGIALQTPGEASNTSVKGELYLAVSPRGVMLGSALAALSESGSTRAWGTLHFDALINIAPFFADVVFGASFGVSVTVDKWFVHVTISAEVGIDVELWCPPFGGNGTLHLWFVSFAISFGEPRPDHLAPVDWSKFQAQLPPPAHALKAKPAEGLSPPPDPPAQETANQDDDTLVWRASTHGFTFTTSAAVPANKLCFGNTPVGSELAKVRVRALGKDSDSVHTVTVAAQSNLTVINMDGWICEPIKTSVPKALWSADPLSLDGDGLLPDRYIGMKITIPLPEFAGQLTTGKGNLSVTPLPNGPMPYDGTATPVGPTPTISTRTVEVIASEIADASGTTTPASKRNDLFKDLTKLGYQLGPNDPLNNYAAIVKQDMAANPLLVPTGGK